MSATENLKKLWKINKLWKNMDLFTYGGTRATVNIISGSLKRKKLDF